MSRSNKQTRVLFVGDDGATHADRIRGGGFGAHFKMMDRAIVALTGWRSIDTKIDFDTPSSRVTLTNRKTGESRSYSTIEA